MNGLLPDDEIFNNAALPSYLRPDDSLLVYTFPFTGDMKNFINKRIVNPVQCRIHEFENIYLPPVYNNQLLDYAQYENIRYPFQPNTTYMYSGSSYFSTYTDKADLERFKEFSGTDPVFMDNSMQIYTEQARFAGNDPYYPGKARLFNIFQPYCNENIKDLVTDLDNRLFFTNFSANSEIDLIRLATAADFMWNTNAYNEDLSLWKVLVSRYGASVAGELIRYADLYGSVTETLTAFHTANPSSREVRSAFQTLESMKTCTASIEKFTGENSRLLFELKRLHQMLESDLKVYDK